MSHSPAGPSRCTLRKLGRYSEGCLDAPLENVRFSDLNNWKFWKHINHQNPINNHQQPWQTISNHENWKPKTHQQSSTIIKSKQPTTNQPFPPTVQVICLEASLLSWTLAWMDPCCHLPVATPGYMLTKYDRTHIHVYIYISYINIIIINYPQYPHESTHHHNVIRFNSPWLHTWHVLISAQLWPLYWTSQCGLNQAAVTWCWKGKLQLRACHITQPWVVGPKPLEG